MPPLRLLFYATSLTGFVLLGSVLAGARVPLEWLLVAFSVHGSLGTFGVFFPAFGVWTDAFCRGEPGRRRIALTFDDGPHPETTRRVLRTLAEHRARATFFVLGEKVRRHPELVREIAAAGHGVALHGDDHDWLYTFRTTASVRRDLERAARAVYAAAGLRPTLFRPPIGFVSHAVALGAESCGLGLVGWTLRVLDGHGGATPERVLRRALSGLADGAILLLHDASEADDRAPASLAVLDQLLAAIERAGLEPVRVDELVADARGARGSERGAGHGSTLLRPASKE